MDLYGAVSYCLSCHRILREEGASICRFCGADQEETRQALMALAEEQTRNPALARRNPLPPNAFQDASCPTCHTVVKAGAGRCPFCLHYMVPPPPEFVTSGKRGYWYAVASVAATTLVWLSIARGSLYAAYFFFFVSITTAFITHGEMPENRLGLWVIAWSGLAMIALVGLSIGRVYGG